MTWAPLEFQKTLFQTLSTDPTLQGLLGGTVEDPRVYDYVPEEKNYPYITMYTQEWEDRGSQTTEGWAAQPQINVWYRRKGLGNKDVMLIQAAIDALIHNKDLCVDGYNIIVLRRSFTTVLTDPDGVTKHGVQRYKLFLGEIQ